MVAVAETTFSPRLIRQWRLHTHEPHEPPTVDHLLKFIERQKISAPDDRLHTLKSDRAPKAKSSVPAKRSALKLQDSAKHHNKVKCITCDSDHGLFLCAAFKDLSIDDRWSEVQQHRLCFSCLGRGHAAGNCSSKGRCHKCSSSHHNTRLHYERERSSRPSTPVDNMPISTVAIVRPPVRPPNPPRVPMTTLAIASSSSHQRKCRVQLDTSATYVISRVLKSLPAHWEPRDLRIQHS